jgi:hypothetical protein
MQILSANRDLTKSSRVTDLRVWLLPDNYVAPVIAGMVVGSGLILGLGMLYVSDRDHRSNIISPYGNQQIAIRIAMSNDTILELFEGKDVEPRGVRQLAGGTSDFLMILMQKDQSERHLAVFVDTTSRRVTSVRPSIGWLSDNPSILRVVDVGNYRVEFSFREPMNKTEFSALSSKYNITITYLEYIATKGIAGGASSQLFSDIYQLENNLKARHHAEITGINKIIANGESMNLLKFIEVNRDNISELEFLQVLG